MVGTIGTLVRSVGKMPNIFTDPKEIKVWAIQLANACGGQRVVQDNVLQDADAEKVNKLLFEFLQSFEQTILDNRRKAEEE
jgi:hypothetical protein|tara:strand:- start:3997 stop:4239 length:243 start_codon:yes stop_codon:yes gene_type:complete